MATPRHWQIVDRVDDVSGLEVDELGLTILRLCGDNQPVLLAQIGHELLDPPIDLNATNPEARYEVLFRGNHIRKRIPRRRLLLLLNGHLDRQPFAIPLYEQFDLLAPLAAVDIGIAMPR